MGNKALACSGELAGICPIFVEMQLRASPAARATGGRQEEKGACVGGRRGKHHSRSHEKAANESRRFSC